MNNALKVGCAILPLLSGCDAIQSQIEEQEAQAVIRDMRHAIGEHSRCVVENSRGSIVAEFDQRGGLQVESNSQTPTGEDQLVYWNDKGSDGTADELRVVSSKSEQGYLSTPSGDVAVRVSYIDANDVITDGKLTSTAIAALEQSINPTDEETQQKYFNWLQNWYHQTIIYGLSNCQTVAKNDE